MYVGDRKTGRERPDRRLAHKRVNTKPAVKGRVTAKQEEDASFYYVKNKEELKKFEYLQRKSKNKYTYRIIKKYDDGSMQIKVTPSVLTLKKRKTQDTPYYADVREPSYEDYST